jgi:hypothetical protein
MGQTAPQMALSMLTGRTEPTRLLCLWVETSNTSLNSTGAWCVAQGLTDTKSLRQSATDAGMTITTRVVKTG